MLKFSNSVPNAYMATQSTLLCSNFLKFSRQEIGEIVRCLPDLKQKTKFRLPFKVSLLCRSHPNSAKASPQQCTHSAADFNEIGPLSAEF